MGLFELVAAVVAVVAVGIGIHEGGMWLGHHWHGIYEVSHRLEETEHWGHPAPFDPTKVRKFDQMKQVLSGADCDFMVNLTRKHHDYNGYADLRSIEEEEYKKLEAATERVIAYMNAFSGRRDMIDHLALRKTPAAGVRAHADNVHWVANNRSWVPNGSGHRTWSSTTVLNAPEDYKGGTFRFHEPHRVDIRPGKGQTVVCDTVVFDASERNIHSVDSVPEGERYVLLVWLAEIKAEHNKRLLWRL